ncbi:hypothetical protein [Porticoccus sp.]|uniref:hypothetical protein n=1 Tax=Porticoccus sp. TaxID=2024853 RepID=UPI003F69EBDD
MNFQEAQKVHGWKQWPSRRLNAFRVRLAHTDALPQLAVLGCISEVAGIITRQDIDNYYQ